MSKDVKSMSREELEAEVLRLRDKMRDDALRTVREIESARAAFERNPPNYTEKLNRPGRRLRGIRLTTIKAFLDGEHGKH